MGLSLTTNLSSFQDRGSINFLQKVQQKPYLNALQIKLLKENQRKKLYPFLLWVVAILKKLNTFDMQHCVTLRCITVPLIHLFVVNMVADVIIFIPLDNYSTIVSLVH